MPEIAVNGEVGVFADEATPFKILTLEIYPATGRLTVPPPIETTSVESNNDPEPTETEHTCVPF